MTRAETPETRVTMKDCRHLVPEHLMPLSSRRPLRRNRRLVFLGSQQPVHLFHFPASCSLRSNTTMVWEHGKTRKYRNISRRKKFKNQPESHQPETAINDCGIFIAHGMDGTDNRGRQCWWIHLGGPVGRGPFVCRNEEIDMYELEENLIRLIQFPHFTEWMQNFSSMLHREKWMCLAQKSFERETQPQWKDNLQKNFPSNFSFALASTGEGQALVKDGNFLHKPRC
ncbi:uncharacterized protein LOC108592839 isoform X1 [Callithrix jacchus]